MSDKSEMYRIIQGRKLDPIFQELKSIVNSLDGNLESSTFEELESYADRLSKASSDIRSYCQLVRTSKLPD